MINLPLNLLEVAVILLETNQVFSGFGVPHSVILFDEVIGKNWFFKPLRQFFEHRRFDVVIVLQGRRSRHSRCWVCQSWG